MRRGLVLLACWLTWGGVPVRCDTSHKARTVLSFAKELNLSTDQRAKITQTLSDLRRQLVACQERNGSLQKALNELLRAQAPLSQVRQKFEEIAANEVEAKMADIGTARKIQEVLTAEQFERWKGIQVKNGSPR